MKKSILLSFFYCLLGSMLSAQTWVEFTKSTPESPVINLSRSDNLQVDFNGFGPKQSRNFLQALGLTKYEIPIDSRITTWLNDFGFPVTLTSSPLGDKGYYHFVSDGIQELCEKAEIYPCILDAAIFSSFDNDEWTDENTIF
ncbi:MAG: hypothetical protein WC271_07755 [Bacteroidales bacterium]|jgi:hypothetical protein|nr:hypothetical protein [Bacteroidales bacterium]MDY0202267.1 hypothetical protein [Tenuifilaceae bacterium]